jgi:hypothetical protein
MWHILRYENRLGWTQKINIYFIDSNIIIQTIQMKIYWIWWFDFLISNSFKIENYNKLLNFLSVLATPLGA